MFNHKETSLYKSLGLTEKELSDFLKLIVNTDKSAIEKKEILNSFPKEKKNILTILNSLLVATSVVRERKEEVTAKKQIKNIDKLSEYSDKYISLLKMYNIKDDDSQELVLFFIFSIAVMLSVTGTVSPSIIVDLLKNIIESQNLNYDSFFEASTLFSILFDDPKILNNNEVEALVFPRELPERAILH